MKLHPVSYKWKKGNQNVNLGLIAQEVQKVIPEVVDVGDDKDKTLGMKYTELIPVLIKGMQEQQKLIDSLQSTVSSQQSEIKSLTSKLVENNKELVKRVTQLEANANQ
jgi:gas vesicle protein